jgi:hypothetical protein
MTHTEQPAPSQPPLQNVGRWTLGRQGRRGIGIFALVNFERQLGDIVLGDGWWCGPRNTRPWSIQRMLSLDGRQLLFCVVCVVAIIIVSILPIFVRLCLRHLFFLFVRFPAVGTHFVAYTEQTNKQKKKRKRNKLIFRHTFEIESVEQSTQ